MATEPTLIAASTTCVTPATSFVRCSPWPRARNARYVGALSRNEDSVPAAQKNCHGSRTPSSPPRTRSSSSAGIIVRKMPKKSTATSVMGYAVTPLARRTEAGVRQSDTPATATIAIPRDGEEHGVGEGGRLEVAREVDAARHHVEARQQDHERDVVLGHPEEGGRAPGQIEGEHGQPERRGHGELVAVRFPPVWDPERAQG